MKTKTHGPRQDAASGHRQQRNRRKSAWQLFKNTIRNARWTQAEAARQLHVTPNYISMICRGHSSPSESLAELLRLKVRERAQFKDERMAKIYDVIQTVPLAHRNQAMSVIERIAASYRKGKQ